VTEAGNDPIQAGYDQAAEEYAAKYFRELDHKPTDRQLLERLAGMVEDPGPICDMGCGPGQIARYLSEHGAGKVFGIDLSEKMVEQARRLNPGIDFLQGDMLNLDVPDASWGGIAAFYSIIHIPRPKVVQVLREFLRVLKKGGVLLLAFHKGREVMHIEDFWGKPVRMDFVFFEKEEMEGYLKEAGFEIVESLERPPYADVEYQSHRVYIFAKRP
jgi:ubiquinone/menaquinone biosynthesis C-methylase UbiE